MKLRYTLAAALVSLPSQAQELEQVPAELAPFVRIVRGSETPSLISKADYIKHLVPALEQIKVDSGDAEVIAAFRDEFGKLQETTKVRAAQRVEQACQSVAAAAMQPSDFVASEAAAEKADDLARIRLYDDAMSRLSALGRAAVEAFLNNTLLPTMTTVSIDLAGIALQYPEQNGILVQRRCALYTFLLFAVTMKTTAYYQGISGVARKNY